VATLQPSAAARADGSPSCETTQYPSRCVQVSWAPATACLSSHLTQPLAHKPVSPMNDLADTCVRTASRLHRLPRIKGRASVHEAQVCVFPDFIAERVCTHPYLPLQYYLSTILVLSCGLFVPLSVYSVVTASLGAGGERGLGLSGITIQQKQSLVGTHGCHQVKAHRSCILPMPTHTYT
jgi:hypothetical protein